MSYLQLTRQIFQRNFRGTEKGHKKKDSICGSGLLLLCKSKLWISFIIKSSVYSRPHSLMMYVTLREKNMGQKGQNDGEYI